MQVILDVIAFDLWLIALGLLILTLFILWRKKRDLWFILCCFIFGVYLLYVIEKAFFPLYIGGQFANVMRQQPILLDINIIPFYFGPFTTFSGALQGLILNVILTIPFGFGIHFIVSIKPKHLFMIAIGVGLTIETIQLILSILLGYAYRVIDINDSLMNILGVLIGYFLFRLFAWIYQLATQHYYIHHNGLSTYIYKMVIRHQQLANPKIQQPTHPS